MKRQIIAICLLLVFVGMTIVPLVLPYSGEQYSVLLVDCNDDEPISNSIEKLVKEHKLISEYSVQVSGSFIHSVAQTAYYSNHKFFGNFVPPVLVPPPDLV